ncbi:MAG: pilus assembly protein [Pseudomonadota bacterium]|nr:pilus assembly protein [Pseudomonadota bacterium]
MIEFALIAPILLALMLGVSDLAPSLMVRYRFSNAVQSVADLATQPSRLQASDMLGLFSGGADVLAPFSSTNMSLRLTSVASDGNGHAFVYWSCASGSFAPTTAQTAVTTLQNGGTIDSILYRYNTSSGGYNKNGTNTSFISVEGSLIYTAPAQFVLKTAQTMSFINYMTPRLSTYVGFPWDGVAVHVPPPPTTVKTIKSMTLSNGAVCSYLG